MANGKLLWSIGVSHLRREKQKKLSDYAATDGDHGVFILRGDVVWPDHVENDGQRESAVGHERQPSKARKAKKSSD